MKHKNVSILKHLHWLLILSLAAISSSCIKADFDIKKDYIKSEYMIPMRDGIKLYTQAYSPRDNSQKFPIMLFRTPYSIGDYGPEINRKTLGPNDMYAPEGFIFVYQDVRGKFKSQGEFTVMRPHIAEKHSPQDTDESSDTYDTIEWILNNVPNHNGRVGQWGISYPAFQTVMGMIDAHPAMKASSPQASPSDMWIGDDFHHNGAFRLIYTFGWLARNAAVRSGPSESRGEQFDYGTEDGYQFFLDLGPVSNVDKKYFHQQVPTWNEYMEHGDYDEYWRKQNVLPHLKNIEHAILNVAGWFDAEDFYGPMSIYYTIEKLNSENKSILAVGPWRHGGWAGEKGDTLGQIRFNSDTGAYFRQEVEFPFFLYHLKGKGDPNLSEAIVFETGTNQWQTYSQWPPAEAEEVNLYFRENKTLAFEAPPKEISPDSDSFISDPGDPVPYSAHIGTHQGHTWMVEDQRFVSGRPDVLVYQTEVLTEDITIAGPIIADLFVSTTGTDADWIVKVIDVFPENSREIIPDESNDTTGHFQMLVGADVFRGKYRHSFEQPEPFIPGEIARITYDLRDKYHCFRKGHRIMVHVQSTWFPLIDRNPQKFMDIYHAQESDFQKAEHTLYRSPEYSSQIKFRILN
ncbi:MAG: CocE/NonD family hydrolase [Candidatus Aminicenantes bacterium]|nr:CocE/NonD family hydrolase [Candidatus Aminicenantes bacterium]